MELDAGDDDGHHLPDRHDDHEDHRAERADGVVDEELASGGADGEDDAVEEECRELKYVRLNHIMSFTDPQLPFCPHNVRSKWPKKRL